MADAEDYIPALKYGKKVKETNLESDVSDALDIVQAIPTSDQEDGVTVWNDGGVLKVSTTV